MKHSARHSNRFGRHHDRVQRAPSRRQPVEVLPPPDPATRVSLGPPIALRRADELPRSSGRGAIVAVGVGGTALAIGSAAVQLLHLPPLSEVGVAAGSVLVAVVSAVEWRRWRERTGHAAADVELPLLETDLPSLTGQIGTLLTELRHQHGLAYRSRTWIDDVLPEFGGPLPQPVLARDLLAVAALDAGGIRANVAGLTHDHEREELLTAARSLRAALQSVLDACEGTSDLPAPPTPDQSCWPVLVG